MTIKTEMGTIILITCALIVAVGVVIGEKKITNDLNTIENSVAQNKAALEE